jgi:hypothetical protein
MVAMYGQGFVGDYVNNLENLVESYRLVNNFHEGKDVAVISLRDDVANVRVDCRSASKNLLKSSADLGDALSWTPRNCNPVTLDGVVYPTLNCIGAVPSPVATPANAPIPDLALPGLTGNRDGAPGFVLQFGDGKACAGGAIGGCGWKPGSALSQIVPLTPGRYRFSWYSRDPSLPAGSSPNGATQASALAEAPAIGIAIVRGTGILPTPKLKKSPDTFMTSSPFVSFQSGSGLLWKRYSIEFQVEEEGEYEIGFGVSHLDRPTYEVTIGAPMLEGIPDNGNAVTMPAFQATDADGQAAFPACEDTDGRAFRQTKWTPGCMRVCDTGFSANCSSGPLRCYHEFKFGVAQQWIQNGKLFNYSGFARGNFNYRIDSLALNFVGPNIRNCADSSLPSTCYNAGFVPYSVDHNGPFFIRNQSGADYETKLFNGHIEHARGLALERYLTNPISGTDRELLAEYFRTEFAGRPLDGNFTIRVWDEPGVDFKAIADVQLVLNYRYWTAFD